MILAVAEGSIFMDQSPCTMEATVHSADPHITLGYWLTEKVFVLLYMRQRHDKWGKRLGCNQEWAYEIIHEKCDCFYLFNGKRESNDSTTQNLVESKECSEGCRNHLVSKTSVQKMQDGRHHTLVPSTALCPVTLFQSPHHFSQAPTGRLIPLFFFQTVMFRLQNKRYGVNTSIGNLRPPCATQNLPARSQSTKIYVPLGASIYFWKLLSPNTDCQEQDQSVFWQRQ